MEKFISTCQNEGFASKICFQQTRKNLSLPGMPRNKLEISFKYPENLFPLTGIAGVSEKKKKKIVSTSQKISYH